MPHAELDGIRTRYELVGDGPPILMFSPGGFDSSLENWTTFGRYAELGFVSALSASYTCVVFDRRESGQSGGRFDQARTMARRALWPQENRTVASLAKFPLRPGMTNVAELKREFDAARAMRNKARTPGGRVGEA